MNRRGRHIRLDVSCGALRGPSGTVQGCILIMDRAAAVAVDGQVTAATVPE